MNRRSDKPALRPATIPEQAAWRPLSVKRELQTENWPALANADDTGPDDYILELGRVLISAQPKCRLGCAVQRPLLGVKRTWRGLVSMSANDPKRTIEAYPPNTISQIGEPLGKPMSSGNRLIWLLL